MTRFIDRVVALVRTAPSAATVQDRVVPTIRHDPEDEPSALNLAMRTAPLDELLEVATGWAQVIGALLDGGVRPDQASRMGKPLLFETLRFTNLDMAHRLLDALPGLDVNQAASDGAIALHLAVRKGDLNLVQRLILGGASIEARTRNGHTPLLGLVASDNHAAMTVLLLGAGANVNAQDENGRTGLHFTVRQGHADLTDVLLDHGADSTRLDQHGRTPRAYAQERLGWLRTEALSRKDKAGEAQQLQAALDRYQDRVVREERRALVAVLDRDPAVGKDVRTTTDGVSPGAERHRRRL